MLMLLRRTLFQVHLWLGITAGLYLCLVSITGAALVFRIDVQRALHSELLVPPSTGPTVDVALVLETLRGAYPTARIAGVDAPTSSRPSYLAYVMDDHGFRSVLIDPTNAQVLGELPEQSVMRTIQDLHFNLLAGKTGAIVNGIGAICLLLLCITGCVIWWPGRRGLTVRWRAGWPLRLRDIHSVVGFWALLLMAMWAATALQFIFPKQFRAAVDFVSPLTQVAAPRSDRSRAAEGFDEPNWQSMIARAASSLPDQFVARVVIPSREDDAFQVLFASEQPTPAGTRDLTTIYLDQYSGEPLPPPTAQPSTAGDILVAWARPIHTGNFGGIAVKVIWLAVGLAPLLLFVTAILTWWRRIVGPTYRRLSRGGDGPEKGRPGSRTSEFDTSG